MKIKLFQKHEGILRTKEAEEAGIHNRTLYYMLDNGYIEKLERGLYQLSDRETLSNSDLVIVAKKVPKARICLISALDFHGMTTEVHIRYILPFPPQAEIPAWSIHQ
jgi:predicted transcriptional regulator of viral defense system